MARDTKNGPGHDGLVWICCPRSVVASGLEHVLEEAGLRVHAGYEPPEGEAPASVLLYVNGAEELSEGMGRVRASSPDALILAFGLRLDLRQAYAAIRAGACGFVHAGMRPEQITRAMEVVLEGEIAAPRKLLEYLINGNENVDLSVLSRRQWEVLKLVADGQSNAQISKHLFLSESTVKQHLRAAYKLLGVRNRTEAAKIVRKADDADRTPLN